MNLKSKAISEIRATIETLSAHPEFADRIEGLRVLLGELESEQGEPKEDARLKAERKYIEQNSFFIDEQRHLDRIRNACIEAFIDGHNEAISQMQPEWVEWEVIKTNKELRQKFNDYNDELIMLQFDDGSIRRYDEDYDRAKIIRVLFLPQPPTK